MLKIAGWHFTVSVQFKCGNNKNELFKTVWFTGWRRGSLNMRHLFMQLTYSERFAWFSRGYRAPPLPRSQTWVPSETSGCLSSSWENWLLYVSLLYAIWHNQHGWNYSMSISRANACFLTSQTEKLSRCKKLVNASALSMALRLDE